MTPSQKNAVEFAIEALDEAALVLRKSLLIPEAAAALRAALAEPEQSEPADFDAAFDSVDWDEWRHRPIRELVRELHKVTTPRREPLTKAEQLMDWRHFTVADVEWCDYQDLYKHFAEIHGIGVKP